MSTENVSDDEIIRRIELATEEMSSAGDEVRADSKEIKKIRLNNKYKPIRGPGFFSVLGMAFKGLFEL